MAVRSVTTIVSVGIALTAASAPAVAATPSSNRVANPGAENGLAGWQGAGFGVASYDAEAIPRYPAPLFPGDVPGGSHRVFDANLGTQLFSGTTGGAISQIVDLADLADVIDSGNQDLSFGGLLGGRRGQTGAARIVIQALDAAGAQVGSAYAVGNPSDRDRQSQTASLSCVSSLKAPVGTRRVQVRLEAVGQGLADDVFVSPTPTARPAVGPPPGFGIRPADGPGCEGELVRTTTENPLRPRPNKPTPSLGSLLMMPAANRCGRPGPLLFRVRRNWRSQVKSVQATARGRRVVRSANSTIRIAAPRRTLRVALRVRMRDGRQRSGIRAFVGCR